MNTIPSPTLPMSSMSCTCSDLRVFWLSRSASYSPLLSLMDISSSLIFGMRPTPNAQSTDALRAHARRCKFASRPPGFGLLPPRRAVVPFQRTCHVALGVSLRSAPSGKCEPHTRKI